jgi:hypothetical protein
VSVESTRENRMPRLTEVSNCYWSGMAPREFEIMELVDEEKTRASFRLPSDGFLPGDTTPRVPSIDPIDRRSLFVRMRPKGP